MGPDLCHHEWDHTGCSHWPSPTSSLKNTTVSPASHLLGPTWVRVGEVGKLGQGGGERRAETGAPMAPKMECPLKCSLSLATTRGEVWVGGEVQAYPKKPGQQLVWSVVSAASLVEGA